ncbi:hypothetical protein AVEN_103541-1 [Araneus ventricosus]|uniref:Uncharacterized protein n=1 Tax=Araneus ventricosus TaxID=182803 RepID=A0A4Y2JKD2_ARAVE|nr:hypothetical protein AVEN_103541-1 [Araneus ventricosus]
MMVSLVVEQHNASTKNPTPPVLNGPSQALYLVISTSRFEVAGGLFWDGLRNFEPRSDDKDDTWAVTTTPTGGRPNTRRIFSGIGFRNWNLPVPNP